MANAGITDRDMGYDAIVASLGTLGEPAVFVGILQDQGGEMTDEGVTVAGYAAVNEFGSEDGTTPERSFIRSTIDDNLDAYQAELDEALGVTVDAIIKGGAGSGRPALDRQLGLLGNRAARDIRDKIRAGGDPFLPNAPSTLAAKYPADQPLRHTNRMRQAISFQVQLDGGDP